MGLHFASWDGETRLFAHSAFVVVLTFYTLAVALLAHSRGFYCLNEHHRCAETSSTAAGLARQSVQVQKLSGRTAGAYCRLFLAGLAVRVAG